ncbi:MAG: DNA polymerase III subunit beta [Spirochaetes bacterium]|nr:DNA polymerase III subunit beta [Spirochaetota bacterium]
MGKKKKNRTRKLVDVETDDTAAGAEDASTAVAEVSDSESDTLDNENTSFADEEGHRQDEIEAREQDELAREQDDIHDDDTFEIANSENASDDVEVPDEETFQAPEPIRQNAAFLITKKQLMKIMTVANTIVWKNAPYSIEGHLIICSSEKALTIRATNNSITFKKHIEVFENSGDAECGVNAKKLYAVINCMPDGLIRFSIEDLKMQIQSEDRGIRYTLICVDAREFPNEPEKPAESEFVGIPCETMKKIIDKTHKFVSKETFKPVLRGVLFKRKGERLIAVATDGKRLGLVEKIIGGKKKDSFEHIVDAEFLKTAYPIILGNYSSTLSMAVAGEIMFLRVGGYELTGRLVEGKYPDYRKVVPVDFAHEFTVNKEDLLNAVRFVAPMISDTRAKRINFELSENTLTLRGMNIELGESERMLPITYVGESKTIGFNYTYLVDLLTSIDGDNVRVRFNNDESPADVMDTERKDYLFIIMPLKMEEEVSVPVPVEADVNEAEPVEAVA